MGIDWGAKDTSKDSTFSVTVEAKLVDILFDQQDSVILSQVATIVLGALAFAQSRSIWIAIWIVMTLVIAPWRLYLARAYKRRPPKDDLKKWTTLFAVGAISSALGFALVASFAVLRLDEATQMVLITGECAFVAGAAARNCVVPQVARVQISLPLGTLAVTCMATGRVFYMVYALVVLFYLLGMMEIVRFMALRTRQMLLAQAEAERVNALLEALATTDPLTGAVNRRGFDTVFRREFEAAKRDAKPFALIMLDLDHFKALNDAYGHQGGDECLRKVVLRIREIVRDTGAVVCRYGGEEFAVLLPETDDPGALAVANVVRSGVEALAIRHPTSISNVMTISIGYASIIHDRLDNQDALIKRADNALYAAKSTGRNRVVGPMDSGAPRLDIGMAPTAEAA